MGSSALGNAGSVCVAHRCKGTRGYYTLQDARVMLLVRDFELAERELVYRVTRFRCFVVAGDWCAFVNVDTILQTSRNCCHNVSPRTPSCKRMVLVCAGRGRSWRSRSHKPQIRLVVEVVGMVPCASAKCVCTDGLVQDEQNSVVSSWMGFLCNSCSLDPGIASRVVGDVA